MPSKTPEKGLSSVIIRPRIPLIYKPNIEKLDRSSVLKYRAPFEIPAVQEITKKYKERSEQR